jgi:hypothetical protein
MFTTFFADARANILPFATNLFLITWCYVLNFRLVDKVRAAIVDSLVDLFFAVLAGGRTAWRLVVN